MVPHLSIVDEVDHSEYSLLHEPPPLAPPRVHPGFPREQRHNIEPQPAQSYPQISVPFGGQKYNLVPKPPKVQSTRPSQPQIEFQNPFISLSDTSPLNPNGKCFNARDWISNLAGFVSKDPQRYPQRSAGFSFRNLRVHRFGSSTNYQKDVGNIALEIGVFFRWITGTTKKRKIDILHGFDGSVDRGEMLLVLGRPGSGVSTFLKTIAGITHGLFIDPDSRISYEGIPASRMHTQFRGEAIYMDENDVHFPHLTVSQTLLFAAKARAPRDFTFPSVTRDMYAKHVTDVMMATFGISHVADSIVGNDIVKGISGGERKRVSIVEAALSAAPLQCWDNSIRGLDSALAMNFCTTLRHQTRLTKRTACVALYQASQDAYDVFDKVMLLYEGRQIFFGPCHEAKAYFMNMGFVPGLCQTTADFLTSLTNPELRQTKPGYEFRTPRSPDEFVMCWKTSVEYANLSRELDEYDRKYPPGGGTISRFVASRRAQQAKTRSIVSPYTLSAPQQVMICIERGFQRLKRNASFAITGLIVNSAMALIIGSVFYNLSDDTASFYSRGVLLFFSIFLNAFASALEILLLFAQRPIVEKQARYAFYHPFAEALSSVICDLPYKICNCLLSSLILYFMTNLRRSPAAFFTFVIFSFFLTIALSMFSRTISAASRYQAQALFPAAVIFLALMVCSGFVIPPGSFVPWLRWINYIDPVAYAFEGLMINEFHNRNFKCSLFVPGFRGSDSPNQVCAAVGAVPGSSLVSGDDYIRLQYGYQIRNLWGNFMIIVVFMIIFMLTYFLATEFVSAKKPNGEALLFRRKHQTPAMDRRRYLETYGYSTDGIDAYGSELTSTIQRQTTIFQWKDICFDIKTKSGYRRVLDNVDGWCKPGTLTALMGASGAGKTSLLDVLATRNTVGVVSGEALVDGNPRDITFQRKTGYVQQADIHLETTTVREALQFSAVMRQPATVSRKEKLAYVEEIINLLGMEYYADAVVGVPGEGLNIEQRKKLTLGVEMAAKPQLLLFLDEPTSGLDSDTSWAIIDLLTKLAAHGQAILCTIHQPSATLFQRFDRLLLLKDGKSVYFGELGRGFSTVTKYFEQNGAGPCPLNANVAEWIMQAVGGSQGSPPNIDWPEVWRNSHEFTMVHMELDAMKSSLRRKSTLLSPTKNPHCQEFASGFSLQFWECFRRINSQYWRTPSFIYSKFLLSLIYALFLGLSFYNAGHSLQDLQNQTFSIFMLLTLALNFIPQLLPSFVIQRELFEARERPAKIYSWQVFMMSNILVEIPWNTLMAVFIFVSWYYPIGMYRNPEPGAIVESGGLMFLLVWVYMMFSSTFGHMIAAALEMAEMAGALASGFVLFSLIFCGILASPTTLPNFWIFMYRCSPFTYLVSAMLSVGLANTSVTCSDIELLRVDPVAGTTCGSYMAPYIRQAGGYVVNPDATSNCSFCAIKNTNVFLASLNISYKDRWRNFGLLWAYVMFNIAMALFLYWLVRVPKKIEKEHIVASPEVVNRSHEAGGSSSVSADSVAKTNILRYQQLWRRSEEVEMIPLDVF